MKSDSTEVHVYRVILPTQTTHKVQILRFCLQTLIRVCVYIQVKVKEVGQLAKQEGGVGELIWGGCVRNKRRADGRGWSEAHRESWYARNVPKWAGNMAKV